MKTNTVMLSLRIQAFFLALIVGFFLLASTPAVQAEVVDEGSWTNKKYKIKGGWEIDTRGGETIIRFNDDFKTKKGPDLKIFLSKKSIDVVTGKTATEDSVLVAELKSNAGTQEYVLPSNIDINDFDSLLIHCEAYSVLWGGADLNLNR